MELHHIGETYFNISELYMYGRGVLGSIAKSKKEICLGFFFGAP